MANRDLRIRETLNQVFQPLVLEVIDESGRHAGHAARNGLPLGETHYCIVMVSDAFAGLDRIKRSRAVHAALDAEFQSGLHALSLSLATPSERRTS